jgi:hypothetical protein
LLGTLEERNLENVAVTGLELAQEVLEVVVPTDLEAVLPATKDGITGLELEKGLLGVVSRAEAGSADIANVVNEVRVCASNDERVLEFLESRSRRVEVLSLLPLDTRELLLEGSTSVLKPVALLGSNVASPVTDFDITLDKSGMQQRLGELVSQRDGLVGTGRDLTVRTVGEGDALLHGILLTLSVGANNSVLGDVVGGHLQLGLLLQGLVGRVGVGIEGDLDILLVGLVDGSGERGQGGQNRVGNREGELLLGGQRGREGDAVVLDRATLSAHSRSLQRLVQLTCMCQC